MRCLIHGALRNGVYSAGPRTEVFVGGDSSRRPLKSGAKVWCVPLLVPKRYLPRSGDGSASAEALAHYFLIRDTAFGQT